MKRVLFVLALALTISAGCAESVVNKSMGVAPGASRAEVISVMGEPRMRSFRENAEALQYCSVNIFVETAQFSTVWLRDGAVIALTSRNGRSCALIREVDWGQAPPDLRISFEK